MAGSVEAVFTDAVFLIVIIGNGVEIGFRRHGLVELGIEYRDVRNAGEDFLAGFDAGEVCRIVKRSEREAFEDDVLDFFCNKNRHCDFLAAVKNTVPDRGDFG